MGSRSSRASAYALAALFFASGFAALLYQMIWQRLLAFFSGADVYSVTMIVAAFMGGLGFGSLAGGHVADRLSVRGRIFGFAVCELAIALFAFASVRIFYDFLYVRVAPSLHSPLAIGLVLFATLLWPTFFMGMSLPLLARALITRTEEAASRIGTLYGVNTLGAAVGSLATVWVLARSLGFAPTIRLGACINLACAAGALLLAARASAGGSAPAPDHAATQDADPLAARTASFRTWVLVYALSGFIALSLEILWFRLLGVVLKSNAFTFGTLLALYLAGVGIGSLVGIRWAARSARPARAFLLLQAGIGIYAGLSVAALALVVDRFPAFATLWTYLGAYTPLDTRGALAAAGSCAAASAQCTPAVRSLAALFAALYLIVPALLVGPPTLLMGASFPFLQKTVQTDLGHLGRRVGWLQTANIAGSMLGAVCTGLLLLDRLGTAWTLRLLVVLAGAFLVLAARTGRPAERIRGPLLVSALAVAATIAAVTPTAIRLWAKVHGTIPDRILVQEDGTGLSVLKADIVRPERTMVFVDGVGHSWLPYGGIHTFMGALPALLHPAPRDAAVIGLGSGDTVFAIGGRPETVRVDCIEIVQPQLHTLRALDAKREYPGLSLLLGDPRVQYTFTDGRAFLMRAGRLYDVIEADALRPDAAYAGNLYSREYFQLLARSLRPGGLAVSWWPTHRTWHTFLHAFPHVAVFGPAIVGSDAPIAFDRKAFFARVEDPAIRDYYRRGGVDIVDVMTRLLKDDPIRYDPAFDRTALTDINTDLFPKDEYLVPPARP